MEYKWTVLSNTTLGALLASIDGTIVLISLPVIFRGIGVNPFDASSFPILIWLLLGYGVVTATLLVTVGRFSDMWGRARMYNAGFAIFSSASVLLFLEPFSGTTGAWLLVGFRLVQGVGASFLFANSAALLTDAFGPSERGKAMGINQIAFIGGSMVGLVVGGILASIPAIPIGPFVLPTWRLIFLVSVPVGIFGTVWAYSRLRETSIRRAHQQIDYVGNVVFAVGLTLVLVSATYGLLPYGSSPTGWSDPWVLAGLATGVGLLVLFPVIESRVKDPMFRLHLFKVRSFSSGVFAAMLGSIARGGVMLLLVVWFQGIWLPLHGYSLTETPLWAGILMMPMIVGFLTAAPLSGWLSDRHGARTLATIGMLIAAATFFLFLLIPVNFVYWEVGALLYVQGVGMGMFASPNTSAVMSSVPPEDRGAASGMLATLQNTGQQLSLALFFTVVIFGLSSGLGSSVAGALSGAGVQGTDLGILSHLMSSSPTGALFGAFLGENPMMTFLTAAASVPGWVPLSPTVTANLLAPTFFAQAIAPAFGSALKDSFLFGGTATTAGAIVSALRGRRFIYGQTTAQPAERPVSGVPSNVTAESGTITSHR